MFEVKSPSPSVTQPQDTSLNADFGFPDSFRKVLAGGLIAATAFFAGCAKTLEERVADLKSLPSPPAATVLEHPDWFKDDTIRLVGAPHFERDDSYTTSSIILIPISTGKSTSLIPIRSTTEHPRFLYTLNEQDSGTAIPVVSASKLEAQSMIVGGKVHTENGSTYLDLTDHVSQAEYEP